MNYKEKKNEIEEKYVEPIKALSRVNNVDMGVAFDMFQDNVTHGTIRYQYVDFNVEEAKALLSEDKEEYVIKLIITKPKITLSQIGSEAFPDQLSTFTTRYDASDVSRTANLILACKKINGKVILPGETFSYNKALGPRTIEAGYRNGKILDLNNNFKEVEYKDTDIYSLYRMYLDEPDIMQQRLFD